MIAHELQVPCRTYRRYAGITRPWSPGYIYRKAVSGLVSLASQMNGVFLACTEYLRRTVKQSIRNVVVGRVHYPIRRWTARGFQKGTAATHMATYTSDAGRVR